MNKILRTFIILMMFAGSVFAQQNQIVGTVVDKDGFPLVSAAVEEIGAQNYTTTDFDGKFTLIPKKELPITLKISAVGFKTQNIQLYEVNEDPIAIILKSDNLLDEVVITGYREQQRKDLVGSVAKINPESVNKIPVPSFDAQIQGKASGVQINSQSGI